MHPQILPCVDDEIGETVLSADDLGVAKEVSGALAGLLPTSTVRRAAQTAWSALAEPSPDVRYLLLWIALEILFGPKDSRELRFRLSQRIALFLASHKVDAKGLYIEAKDCYDRRSDIVHGNAVDWRRSNARHTVQKAEGLVRSALRKILGSTYLVSVFNDSEREQYLDNLVFDGPGLARASGDC